MKKTLFYTIAIIIGYSKLLSAVILFTEDFDGTNFSDNQILSGSNAVNANYSVTINSASNTYNRTTESTSSSSFYEATLSTYGYTSSMFKGTGSTVASTSNTLTSSGRALAVSADTGSTNYSQTKMFLGTGSGVTSTSTSAIDVSFNFYVSSSPAINSTFIQLKSSSGAVMGNVLVGSTVTTFFNGSSSTFNAANNSYSAGGWYTLNLQMSDASSGTYVVNLKNANTGALLGTTSGADYQSGLNFATLEFLDQGNSSTQSFNYFDNIVVQTAAVPEASTWMSLGVFGLGILIVRRAKNAQIC
ncbi:MAG: hypothetical protein V4507_02955 [Verrucomicrobiota bacterium]